MPDDFTSCKTKDQSAYDYFSCQFFDSITKYQSVDPNGYWFGRLVAFGYTLEDFLTAGDTFAENDLRSGFENGSIILHGYTLISADYAPDQADPNRATVSGKVELDITKNGQRQTVTREFIHELKRTWQAVGTVFS